MEHKTKIEILKSRIETSSSPPWWDGHPDSEQPTVILNALLQESEGDVEQAFQYWKQWREWRHKYQLPCSPDEVKLEPKDLVSGFISWSDDFRVCIARAKCRFPNHTTLFHTLSLGHAIMYTAQRNDTFSILYDWTGFGWVHLDWPLFYHIAENFRMLTAIFFHRVDKVVMLDANRSWFFAAVLKMVLPLCSPSVKAKLIVIRSPTELPNHFSRNQVPDDLWPTKS